MTSKIYTKTGDDGSSKTITGKRKPKSNPEFDVLGTIDELNACLGLLSTTKKRSLLHDIRAIQTDLFHISSYFAGITMAESDRRWILHKTDQLEILIDEMDPYNKPLKNFILPGGTIESSYLHLARTICRCAERCLVKLYSKHKEFEHLNVIEPYFNRLADYLFVLARYYNDKGRKDVIWRSSQSLI